MYQRIIQFIEGVEVAQPEAERKVLLDRLADYIKKCLAADSVATLNFICTHNSRRSQLSQLIAKVVASYFEIELETFSGGTEVTAFHANAIAAIKAIGFKVEEAEGENPIYQIHYSEDQAPLKAFSKLYDDRVNPQKGFAAVMTCSSADQACPHIPNAEIRIPLTYQDPKVFDNTAQAKEAYLTTASLICSEMKYVMSLVKSN